VGVVVSVRAAKLGLSSYRGCGVSEVVASAHLWERFVSYYSLARVDRGLFLTGNGVIV
jgi:hypothetical protein